MRLADLLQGCIKKHNKQNKTPHNTFRLVMAQRMISLKGSFFNCFPFLLMNLPSLSKGKKAFNPF